MAKPLAKVGVDQHLRVGQASAFDQRVLGSNVSSHIQIAKLTTGLPAGVIKKRAERARSKRVSLLSLTGEPNAVSIV